MKFFPKTHSYLIEILPIYSINNLKKELILNVPSSKILPILTFLKYHTLCQYKILSDLCALDFPEKKLRFNLIYNLISIHYNTRIIVKTSINEMTPLSSISSIFPGANWWEREIWDLFGIYFYNHPDLRPLLTDYGFEGYPLRKDFPLIGYLEVRYEEKKNQIIFEPLELSQDFKSFDFKSPWESIKI